MITHHANPMLILAAVAAVIIVMRLLLASERSVGAQFLLKTPLLSPAEQELYRLLVATLPDHVVLAQVAFSQLLKVEGGSRDENFRKYATARQKVADFVICDKSFSVVAVVELDDSTHSRDKDARRDAIITEAGAKTVRWRARKLPSPDEIRTQVLGS